ncbi:putative metalloprotease CJM1_0395 family protein [Marinobacter sp. CHS3-4]|uniref:putative metalloprotease CJM1_0395 family protein n=1 Tax=Marinobacter sp. CHS3-4 TaxID=3045174 RepID=UPI0024B5D507|nr:putative metalloprotease CJM1_0395 family protein [Marinobacter sp. CHS3-4]MDI9244892.1 putative metalloprotease CJM1_0395 family protein [Marinobacter sp. CHS3-4]
MNLVNPLSSNPLTSKVPAFRVSGTSGATTSAPKAANETGSGQQEEGKSKISGRTDNPEGLDSAELKQLTELKARDREVRAHEAAHQAVGGQYAGAISYVYERGPDGAQYAVGGEVSIDTSPVSGDPQATIEKMRTVRAAALAPAEPSPQDRAVAAQAMQLMLQAQAELATDSGSRDSQGPKSAESSNTPRVNEDASRTYQSVEGFAGADAERSPSVPFQATA